MIQDGGGQLDWLMKSMWILGLVLGACLGELLASSEGEANRDEPRRG